LETQSCQTERWGPKLRGLSFIDSGTLLGILDIPQMSFALFEASWLGLGAFVEIAFTAETMRREPSEDGLDHRSLLFQGIDLVVLYLRTWPG